MENKGCMLVCNIKELIFNPPIEQENLQIELSVGPKSRVFPSPSTQLSMGLPRINSSDFLRLRTLSPFQAEGSAGLSSIVDSKQINTWISLRTPEGEVGRANLIGQANTELPPSPWDICQRCQSLEKAACNLSGQQEALNEAIEVMARIAPLPTPRESNELKPEDLALDPEHLAHGNGALTAPEAEHLRMMLIGLKEKAYGHDILIGKIQSMANKINESVREKEFIHEEMRNTLAQVKAQNNERDREENLLNQKLRDTVQELEEMKEMYRAKCLDEELIISKLKQFETENHRFLTEKKNFERMQELIDDCQRQREEMEERRKRLCLQFEEEREQYSLDISELDKEKQLVVEDNASLHAQLNQSENQIGELKAIINDLSEQLYKEKALTESLRADIESSQDQIQKASEMEELAVHHQKECQRLNDEIQTLSQSFSLQIESLNSEKEDLMSTIDSKNSHISSLGEEIVGLKKQIACLQEELKQREVTLNAAEEKLCIQEDQFSILDLLQRLKQTRHSFLQPYYQEMEFLCHKLLRESEHTLTQYRVASRCSESLRQREAEIAVLREMVAELQRYKAYKPVKGDPVDEALAEYLMARSTPLDVPFIREDKGVYLFGTKRVFMKLEAGKIILRVGGGFMHIDDFVDAYTPLELERIEGKTHDSNKKPLGKMAASVVKDKSRGALDISPQKAAAIIKESLVDGSTNFTSVIGVARKSMLSKKLTPQRRRMSYSKY